MSRIFKIKKSKLIPCDINIRRMISVRKNFLNHFNKYHQNIKDIQTLIENFEYILDNIWDENSYQLGRARWCRIMNSVLEPFRTKITMEISHVHMSHMILRRNDIAYKYKLDVVNCMTQYIGMITWMEIKNYIDDL